MNVILKEEYKGQLGLKWNYKLGDYEYILTHYTYPDHAVLEEKIEPGDQLVVRRPADGSIVISCEVDLEDETNRIMNVQDGTFHQIVSNIPVAGLQKNIEPNYWISLFANGYYADLTKKV